MANLKLNKTIARSIVIIGTVLAGLGIWTTVASHPQLSSSTAPIVIQNPNFSATDTFLTQPNIQTGPATSPVQPSITQQPTPTLTQPSVRAPANPAPVITPAPRFRTRGS